MAANNVGTSGQVSAWGHISQPPMETMSFAAIVKAQELQKQESQATEREKLKAREGGPFDEALLASAPSQPSDGEWEEHSELLFDKEEEEDFGITLPPEVMAFLNSEEAEGLEAVAAAEECGSDAVIAQMLQAQYDREYNDDLRRLEQAHNKQSKITVTLEKFKRHYCHDEADDCAELPEEDENFREKRAWDRFETNERKLDAIPKCGYTLDEEGEMITKHDANLCGVRNACRVMSFPPEFATGDGAGFDMKLSNRVFNQLKTYSRRGNKKFARMQDRRDNVATAEMGVDGRTRLLLYKLINNQILEQINGIISTGKEAVILHANSDPTFAGSDPAAPQIVPKECAVKIFKTTLNDFKQRDRYIKDDFRFKDRFNVRFSKQNNFVIINMWAEKEMHNLMRMQRVGINCPEVVVLKKHVLVMSFIGRDHVAAPKLKDASLSAAEWSCAYEEVVAAMHRLYNEAQLVHADLSEYNILWHEGKCWFIDVAQSVEPQHPSALEFLMRDCDNIVSFFSKRGVPDTFTKEQLFEHITALNAEDHNAAMLERIHTRGASVREATAPNQEDCPEEVKPLEYPFDLAWEKSQIERHQQPEPEAELPTIDQAANAMAVLHLECRLEAAAAAASDNKGDHNASQTPIAVATANEASQQ